MKFAIRTMLTVCTALLACAPMQLAVAQEQILSFHNDIQLAVDGSMVVTETIRVRAEGDQIRRGIVREFPTRYSDRFGNRFVVDFEVLSVRRNNLTEAFSQQNYLNGVRIYIGREDVMLAPGEYSYSIRYRTNRQIGFFEDHDELYWNVTGVGWAFSIQQASAEVRLPAQVAGSDITMTGYTGGFGDSGQAFSSSVSDSTASIVTISPLPSQQGLTLVMSWPKGVITEPDSLQKMRYLLSDNLGLLLALIALIGSFVYLYTTWSRIGRDPDAGVVFPHYEPPKSYSPASTRYISQMGYDNKTFAAALINLAVKGHLTITEEDDKYTLSKLTSSQTLAPGEKTLLNYLFTKSDTVKLENKNHSLIARAKSKHRKALRNNYLNIYFSKNTLTLLPSLLGSAVILALILLSDSFVILVVAIFALIGLLHIAFLYFMKAPSTRGRLLMDKLEGFKLYLEVAEQDDLNLRNPPDKTPELFEKYLPFAIALGVEQAWAEQFTAVFAALETQQKGGYHPIWYHGNFHVNQLNEFTTSMSTNMTSAISSASTAPGTTSGAGGYSGGGGGGGGGGGW